MNCNTCNKPSKMNAPQAVVEINNPPEVVLFHKVPFPASMGDETTNPPDTLNLKNVILEYEATGVVYLCSSDGVPTRLTPDLRAGIQFNDLVGRPKYAGLPMTDKTVIPVVPTAIIDLKDGADLQTAVANNTSTLDVAMDKLDTLTTQVVDATKQVATNTSAIASNAEQLATETSAREEAVASLTTSLTEETEARKSAVANLQAQIDAGGGSGGDVPAEVTALQQAVSDINTNLATVKTGVSANTSDISDLNDNVATLTSTVNGYSSDIQVATATATVAQNAAETAQTTATAAQTTATEAQSGLAALSTKVDNISVGWVKDTTPRTDGWEKYTQGDKVRYCRSVAMTSYSPSNFDAGEAGSIGRAGIGVGVPQELKTSLGNVLLNFYTISAQMQYYTDDEVCATCVGSIVSTLPLDPIGDNSLNLLIYRNKQIIAGTNTYRVDGVVVIERI